MATYHVCDEERIEKLINEFKNMINSLGNEKPCKSVIKITLINIKYCISPIIKQEGDEIRCPGYVTNFPKLGLSQKCEKCKFQYGDPFNNDYWSDEHLDLDLISYHPIESED